MRIAIIGGGVGGLTAALALLRRGFEVDVLEQAPAASAVGASLQLGPNALRLLDEMGLLSALRTIGVRPDAVDFLRWDDGSLLLHQALGEEAEAHFGAPQLDFYRPDLHRALADALPDGVLRLGVRV
jgi:salicylate hydroxylase